MEHVWQRTLTSLRSCMTRLDYETWIEPMRLRELRDDVAVLACPHADFVGWVREHYLTLVARTLASVLGHPVEVQLVAANDGTRRPAREPAVQASVAAMLEVAGTPPLEPVVRAARPAPEQDAIHADYTFETFVVGPSNQFAQAACEAVADNPAGSFNPLFVYGGTGLGKTHLLHAIANRIAERHPALRVRYIQTEEYINELVQCIRTERMEDFRFRYRNECDVFLVDDVQFLANKEHCQTEFFHTFNALYGKGRQLVLTSDRPPGEMPGLTDRLRTRFEWGVMTDIQPPEIETRAAIVARKAEHEGIALTEDVVMFLATHIRSNVRVLEGSLLRVAAYARLTGRPLDLALAREVLGDVLRQEHRHPSVEQITQAVARHFHVRVADLKGKRRLRAIARPRMVAMYLCRKLTTSSLPEIGRIFGGRDHSTVIHAVRKITQLRNEDPAMDRAVRELERQLSE